MDKKYGALSSSADSQEMSLTISSLIKLIGTVIAGVLALKGINISITDYDVQVLTDIIVMGITGALAVWHSVHVLYGLVRKAIVWQADK